MPITIDSRGVTVYISDDQARLDAKALVDRSEQSLDWADARGYPLNDSDAQRVQDDLLEAQRLLTDVGDYGSPSGPVDLKRFVQPGWAEQELAARADAEARRREQTQRMAATYRLVEQLGEDDEETPTTVVGVSDATTSLHDVTRSERVNVKRVEDAAGVLWVVSGRGETKKYATREVAEREARRRATGR